MINNLSNIPKLFLVCFSCFFIPSIALGCGCGISIDDIRKTFADSDGLYVVSIQSINQIGTNGRVDIGLKVLKVISGRNKKLLKASGTAFLPSMSGDHFLQQTSSCDLQYSFGDIYVIAFKEDDEISIQQCQNNVFTYAQYQSILTE